MTAEIPPDRRHRILVAARIHQPFALALALAVTFLVGLPSAALAQSLSLSVDPYWLKENLDDWPKDERDIETTLKVTLNGDNTFSVGQTIELSFRGAATPEADFTIHAADRSKLLPPYRLTPMAGENSVIATLKVVDDEEDEGGEVGWVTATLSGTSASATDNFWITGSDRKPKLVDSWIDGTVVTLIFDRALIEDLSGVNTRPDLYFKMEIKKSGEPSFGEEACPIVGGVVVRGNTVTLTFAEGVEAGDMANDMEKDIAKLTYSNMSVNTPIQDLKGQNAQTFTIMLDNRTGQTPTTRPGRPDNLDADPDDQRVTLTWDLPTNTGGTEALTYQWRQGSTGTWESTGTQTTKTVTGLDNGTTYTFYVQAVNSAGAGPSASVTGRPAGRPGAPQNLMVEPGNQQVRIRWSPPANNGGSPIRKYEWKQGSGGWTSTGTAATVLVTSLNNNTGYTFYVRAVNDSGEGPEVSIDATPSQTEFAPSAPTNLQAQPANRRVTLTWNPPENNGGASITRYEWSQGVTDSWTSTGLTRRATISSLDNGIEYTFRVRAVNSVGHGPSATAAATPCESCGGGGGGGGGASKTEPDPPTRLMAQAVGSRRIDLYWSAAAHDGGSPVTGYRIEVSADRGATWRVLRAHTGSTLTMFEHTGLEPQNTRHYRVYAINSIGTGLPSNVASATTTTVLSGAPLTLSAAANGISQIDLSWSAPASDGGAPITGYQIKVSTDDGATWSILRMNTGSTATTYAHEMLPPGTTRHYQVSAVNRVGVGPASNVASATTDATLPGAPGDLIAVADGADQIDLAWSPPTFDGGSPVIGYRIDVSTSSGGGWLILMANTGSTATEYSHENLDPATMRYYRVFAINAEGTGPPSNVADATTDATLPDAPTNLGAMVTSTTRIDLSWNPPAYDGGSPVTSYEIEGSDDGESGWISLATSLATSYADMVAPGTTRYYRVRAVNTVGAGPPSNVASARTDNPKERANRINLNILPYAAAAMTASTVSAITDRIEGAATGSQGRPRTSLGGFSSLAGMVGMVARGIAPGSPQGNGTTAEMGSGVAGASPAPSIFTPAIAALRRGGGVPNQPGDPEPAETGRTGAPTVGLGALAGIGGLGLRQSLGGTSFLMPLGMAGNGSQEESTEAARTMAWGAGDYRVLDGPRNGAADWNGDILSLHAGADTRLRSDLLSGVALSRSTSAFDFTDRTGPQVVSGDYEADITSVHPYLAWFSGERSLAIWTTAGYGGGEVSIEESTGNARSGETRLLTAALGGSATVLAPGSASLRAKGEVWMTRVNVEENRDMDALAVDMKRGRLAVEGNRAHHFDSGDELALSLETGLRYDGGDGAEGGALELGGGLRYARPSLGLTAEARGRMMATRQEGYREWGFSGRIQIDPQTLGEGLALRLVPSWGESSGGVHQLWEHGAMGAAGNGLVPRGRGGVLNAEVEYGLRSFAGTPYGGFYLGEGGSRVFNSGVRYQADMRGSLFLEASHRESATGPATHALIFRGQWRLR